MRATFTDEQVALADAARDLAKGGREAARATLDGSDLPVEPTASLLSGFSGLAVPEDAGGEGGGLVDLAILVESLGRTLTPTPWVSHAMAIQVAHAAGIDVADAASGDRRLALAVEEEGQPFGSWTTTVNDKQIDGNKTAVRDAAGADGLVVVCADDRVALTTDGAIVAQKPFDTSRPLAAVAFDGAGAEAVSEAGDGLWRATVAVSAELVGVGRGAVDLAAEYAKVREQFGQAIGRFQGVAHQLADAWTEIELAWSLALYAAWAVDDAAPDAVRSVHAAKQAAGDAAVYAAERCTQVHGGIGMTWEADPHLFLRRAISDDRWLGTSRHHRRLLGDDVVSSARA
jgi:alkylation response protein AidB-like acyl-CoA dehydrogenase